MDRKKDAARAVRGAQIRWNCSIWPSRACRGSERDGQRELAAAVADAMALGHHLVAEAPTGSGKSLAYLAPAVASGLKVVVATSTIALQSQLVGKDLPVLRRARLGAVHVRAPQGPRQLPLSAPSSAPRRNPTRCSSSPSSPRSPSTSSTSTSSPRRRRPATAPSSSRAIADSSWAAVSCTSTECPGRTNCADGDECFAELARDRAQAVDILVVNHALYCADLAAHGNVLPPHDLVIIDEAHSFADNATNAFGADLSAESIVRLSGLLAKAGVDMATVDAIASSAKELGERARASRRPRRRRQQRAAQLRAARRRRTPRNREHQARQARRRQREAHRTPRDRPSRGAAPSRRSQRRRRRVDREGPQHAPHQGRARVGRRPRSARCSSTPGP